MTPAAVTAPSEDELLTVVGPTGSGKSDLALALAERFDGEIVGADSVQIYRHFDLGSAKPSMTERARVPHHLVDEVDPLSHFDAAHYVKRADQALADIRSRGRVPIICGGTFLWVKALLFGLAPAPPADAAIRQRHHELVQARGRAALHAELARVDPDSATRLAPNDLVRVSRALEVFELTSKTQTSWHAEHQFRTIRHRARLLGVQHSREQLDARIEARTRRWLDEGWIDEVRRLIAAGYEGARAMDSVGYRQVRSFVSGELAASELHEAIVRATRRFVRRQRTWLRAQPVVWVSEP